MISVRIPKKAEREGAFRRPLIPFRAARDAFRAFLEAAGFADRGTVLLPAYVGWSPREGSGVYDPVREIGARSAFYRLQPDLSVDLGHLGSLLEGQGPHLFVLIHYFGYPAGNAKEAIELARAGGALVLEDEAHALLTDWVGGVAGRLGDAAILSLHKILPVSWGGALTFWPTLDSGIAERLSRWPSRSSLSLDLLSHDLWGISDRRRGNAEELARLLTPVANVLAPVFGTLPAGVVPQTFPVRVMCGSRDELYRRLNESGYGAVSLYHTLIEEIGREQYPESHGLARCILNLPIHQDVTLGTLSEMAEWLLGWADRG